MKANLVVSVLLSLLVVACGDGQNTDPKTDSALANTTETAKLMKSLDGSYVRYGSFTQDDYTKVPTDERINNFYLPLVASGSLTADDANSWQRHVVIGNNRIDFSFMNYYPCPVRARSTWFEV